MRSMLRDLWKMDRWGLIGLLCLNIALAVTGGVSTMMLVPMLDLLELPVDGTGLQTVLRPFAALGYTQRVVVILCAFVLVMVARTVLKGSCGLKENLFFEGYEMALRSRLYDAVTSADWEPLSKVPHGQLLNLLMTQCRQAKMCLQCILGLVSSGASALIQLAIAFWLSPAVTVLVLVVGGACMLLFRPFQEKSRACGREAIEMSRRLYQEVNNQLGSIKEIRTYGVEAENARLFRQVCQENLDVSQHSTRLRVVPQMCYGIASVVLIVLAFVVSIWVLDMDVASLVILVYVFSRLWPVFSTWQGQFQRIQLYIPAYEKIWEMCSRLRKEPVAPARSENGLPLEREVAFDHVSFTYQDGREPVLKDVSFCLAAGSVTALVGKSGTGKTTVADLLLGLLHPTKGHIRVDGQVLRQENMSLWHKSVGYVPQDPLIVDGTLRDNLRRFHPEASEEEMIRALKDAHAWHFVEKLEKGMDTLLGTKGMGLSGGERQRIVLARVLLGRPRLIVLDEATSALDYESEKAIRETLHALKGKTAVLLIAHRLATIRTADRAIVLENGRVTEDDSLEALLEKEGSYLADMVGQA